LSFGRIDLRLAAYPKVYRLASPGQGGGGPNQPPSHLPSSPGNRHPGPGP